MLEREILVGKEIWLLSDKFNLPVFTAGNVFSYTAHRWELHRRGYSCCGGSPFAPVDFCKRFLKCVYFEQGISEKVIISLNRNRKIL